MELTTIFYRAILLMVIAILVINMYDEKKFMNHIMSGMVIIPLVLRLLMIK